MFWDDKPELECKCICCKRPLEKVANKEQLNQPVGGIEFVSNGTQGSKLFEDTLWKQPSMPLVIVVCDDCIRRLEEEQFVGQQWKSVYGNMRGAAKLWLR